MAEKAVSIVDTEIDWNGLTRLAVSALVIDKDKLTLPGEYTSPFVLESSFRCGEDMVDSVTDSDGLVRILSNKLVAAAPISGYITLRKANGSKEGEAEEEKEKIR